MRFNYECIISSIHTVTCNTASHSWTQNWMALCKIASTQCSQLKANFLTSLIFRFNISLLFISTFFFNHFVSLLVRKQTKAKTKRSKPRWDTGSLQIFTEIRSYLTIELNGSHINRFINFGPYLNHWIWRVDPYLISIGFKLNKILKRLKYHC